MRSAPIFYAVLAVALWLAFAPSLFSPSLVHAATRKTPKLHRIYKGQTLGKLSKRYNVSIDSICHANGIDRSDPVSPGDKLCIPPRSDADGEETRIWCDKRPDGAAAKTEAAKKKAAKKKAAKKKRVKQGKDGTRWHRVYKGQHLGMIARRYNVTVESIRNANEISRRAPIIPNQQLLIPARDDKDGSRARKHLDAGPPADRLAKPTKNNGKKNSWDRYTRRPERRNFISLVGRKGRQWKGTALTKNGRVRGEAKRAFKRVLATSDGKTIDIAPRLIQLITRVSNQFGGRTIRLVSGYRLGETSRGSRHRKGRAIDFIIEGVPDKPIRDFVKTFDDVGVGYYPSSHFVHLDVREQWTYWIDYAGPGQPPRYAGFWTQ